MRILGTIAGVVNIVCMFLASVDGDLRTFLIAWAGAAFSGYAILQSLEDEEDMGETSMGFRSLAARIRWDLQNANLPPGTRLPSVGETALKYNTTRTTVSRALHILADEGLVEIVQGRGTYVIGGTREDRPKDRIAWELLDELKDRPSGAPFPSSTEIMRRFTVSHPTVRRVHKELLEKGLIRKNRNGGYEKV